MPGDIGYVVKVYPRFSETFIVTEILSREAQGEQLHLFALRPTTDTHFHGALARVRAGWDGACAGCGRPIPAERLIARPAADRCVRCAARHPR